jgi:hypothetical protein
VLEQALKAEAAGQYDLALDRLYRLVIEHPQTPELRAGRLHLARLLALAGNLPAAVYQCQALRNDPEADEASRQVALGIATTLSRRLRSSAKTPAGALATGVVITIGSARGNEPPPLARSYFSAVNALPAPGLTKLNQPSAVVASPSGPVAVVDPDGRRAYRITAEGASAVPGAAQPSAATFLPDGTLIVADASGFVSSATGKAVPYAATGGKAGGLTRVRSLASNARGDLFAIDRGIDGVVRCKAGGTSCVPWGPAGRYKSVKVGAADLVHLLDESGQTIRIVDDSGRQVATMGPLVGDARLENVADIAVDEAFGIYALDTGGRKVQIAAVQLGGAGVTIKDVSTVPLPTEGESAVRDAAAIGITVDGSMLIATRGSQRIFRFQ